MCVCACVCVCVCEMVVLEFLGLVVFVSPLSSAVFAFGHRTFFIVGAVAGAVVMHSLYLSV